MTIENALKLSRTRLRKACAKAMDRDIVGFTPDWDMDDAWGMLVECRQRGIAYIVWDTIVVIAPLSAVTVAKWIVDDMQPADLARACLVALTDNRV